MQNLLPVGKERGYFDPWGWMRFTPTRCATLRPSAEQTEELEAARARQGFQRQPRARGEAPTAPPELSPDGTGGMRDRRRSRAAWEGENGWEMVVAPHQRLFSALLLPTPAPESCRELEKTRMRLVMSQRAGDTRIWQRKTVVWGENRQTRARQLSPRSSPPRSLSEHPPEPQTASLSFPE